MTDALGRIEHVRDVSQNARGKAIDRLMDLMQYRRDLLEARALARDLAPGDVAVTDDDIRNVNAAILTARQELAASRAEGLTLADPEPDLGGFYAALQADPAVGLQKMIDIDGAVPQFREAARERNWPLAWAILGRIQAAGLLDAPQRAAVDAAWVANSLPAQA